LQILNLLSVTFSIVLIERVFRGWLILRLLLLSLLSATPAHFALRRRCQKQRSQQRAGLHLL